MRAVICQKRTKMFAGVARWEAIKRQRDCSSRLF